MEFLKVKGITLITPVLICGGAEEMTISKASGRVTAGNSEVSSLAKTEAVVADTVTEEPKK